MTDTIVARIAALKATPTPDLRNLWWDLFETDPPRQTRRFLESRLAYRIQELEYGELKPTINERLAALGEELDGGNTEVRKARAPVPTTPGRRPRRC